MSEVSENIELFDDLFVAHKVRVFLKREDLLHPLISGNKFRKLKYNLLLAKAQKATTLLTFGGAFSNHIAATAAAGKLHSFRTIGVIRGEELGGENLQKTLTQNATLAFAKAQGMQLHFVTRQDYKNKTQTHFIEELQNKFGDFYLIPEGGTNDSAIKGCQEIITKAEHHFDYVCCAVGTGGTISGIINSVQPKQQVLGFPALKGSFLNNEIASLVSQSNWKLIPDYHFGGYAKINEELVLFMNDFFAKHHILLDPIYTAKMMYGIYKIIAQKSFSEKSCILAVHTGGLQGIDGVNNKLKNKQTTQIITPYEL